MWTSDDPCGAGWWAATDTDLSQCHNKLNHNRLREVLTAVFPILAIHNGVELVVMLFLTFKRYRGVYFWSLLVAAVGIVLQSLANLLDAEVKWPGDGSHYAAYVVCTIGWWATVTGTAFVLWSRLHLVLHGTHAPTILHWTKWMIIANIFLLHLPTTILTFGSVRSPRVFARAYAIIERVHITGFFLQETLLSAIYIWAAAKMLRGTPNNEISDGKKKQPAIFKQLIGVNVVVITLDLGLCLLQAMALTAIQVLVKNLIYAIKLKLEFVILGRLVTYVNCGALSSSDGSVTAVAGNRASSIFIDGGLRVASRRSSSAAAVAATQQGGVEERKVFQVVDVEAVGSEVTEPTVARVVGGGGWGGGGGGGGDDGGVCCCCHRLRGDSVVGCKVCN